MRKLLCSRRSLLAMGLTVWGTAVMAGTLELVRYSSTPGQAVVVKKSWPVDTEMLQVPGRANLVMCVHPECPCSRASVSELEVLIARCHGKISATVLFMDYPDLTGDVTQSPLWKTAEQIPDVVCVKDQQGRLCDFFQARTSGQVFLYDDGGEQRFSGGITDSRGHEGDNDGLLAIEAIVNHSAPTTSSTPVFGCPLR